MNKIVYSSSVFESIFSRSKLLDLLVLLTLLVATEGWAQAIGSDGGRGTIGVGGSDGGPGGAGGDGVLESEVSNGRNTIVAIGGRGGLGGNGQPPAGNGGDGGAGGNAWGVATTFNDSNIYRATTVDARGGIGGDGGQPAAGDTTLGGSGGAGGRADAIAEVVGTNVDVEARGGAGGIGSGAGSAGGAGGDAFADVQGRFLGNGPIEVLANAIGGGGGTTHWGSILGDGGSARSVARAEATGSGSVYVSAFADGGAGGRLHSGDPSGGDGGSAEVEAFGESLGGGYVRVVANGAGGDAWRGRGGSVRLVDAVDGDTAGYLELVQVATGGESVSGVGGDAESRLSRRDEDGVSIHLSVVARGGSGGVAGGNAVASVDGIGAGNVTVEAQAVAGRATSVGGSGGVARLDRVSGVSLGGGSVRVDATLVGTAGRAVSTDSRDASPDILLDAIVDGIAEGSTSGWLTLEQSAHGAGAIDSATGSGAIARAGSAFNRLDRRVSAAMLEVSLDSSGGVGVTASDRIPTASDGGNGATVARLANEVGGIIFSSNTSGGDAGMGNSVGRGGDASLDVEVETLRDGADILFNAGSGGVRGGDAYRSGYPTSGRAGDATSRSVGRALGDSAVEVYDYARGGRGSSSGDAASYAMGSNAGSQSVFVLSRAESGPSVDFIGPAVRGRARSEAHGFSPQGSVEVEAIAASNSTSSHRFMLSPQMTGGVAIASATAEGGATAEGSVIRARADSLGMAGAFGESAIATRTSAYGVGGASIGAHAVTGDTMPAAPSGSGAEVSIAFGGAHARSGEWGRGEIGIRADETDSDLVVGGDFAFIRDARSVPSTALFVSFLAFDLDDDDFESLAFRIVEDDEMLLDRTFEDATSARAFFAAPLSIASAIVGLPSDSPSSELVISFEGSGVSPGTDFRLALAIGLHVVPEPGTASLLAIGLALLASRRRGEARGAESLP